MREGNGDLRASTYTESPCGCSYNTGACQPSNTKDSRIRPDVGRDERDGLTAGLPQLHISAMNLLFVMIQCMGSAFAARQTDETHCHQPASMFESRQSSRTDKSGDHQRSYCPNCKCGDRRTIGGRRKCGVEADRSWSPGTSADG